MAQCSSTDNDAFADSRLKMVATIEQEVQETAGYTGKNALDKRVMKTMASVARHQFVPSSHRSFAYNNSALSIGQGQTISQPYIVALMTDLIAPQPHHNVLEIGTGSGYQTAVLSQLVRHVYSIEAVPQLAARATQALCNAGCDNVSIKQGSGFKLWQEMAPFDAIIVTAAGAIPSALVDQLKPGGRMVIPVDDHHAVQYLTLLEKDMQGTIRARRILPVRFVPLIAATADNPDSNTHSPDHFY